MRVLTVCSVDSASAGLARLVLFIMAISGVGNMCRPSCQLRSWAGGPVHSSSCSLTHTHV